RLWAPGNANPRSKTPLPAGKGRGTHARRGTRTISSNNQPGGSDRVRHRVIGILARIKIKKVSVLLRQSSVPIKTHPRSDGKIGAHLKFVLDILACFVGSPVAVRVSGKVL